MAKAAGVDLFEIKPAVPYSRADLDWTNKKSRSSIEMQNPDSPPAIAEQLSNIEDYDTIFIGFPIWWYVAPTIIDTFFGKLRFFRKNHYSFRYFRRQRYGKNGGSTTGTLPNCKLERQ